MLGPILGSVNSERVLMYILLNDEGYTRQIARFFQTWIQIPYKNS